MLKTLVMRFIYYFIIQPQKISSLPNKKIVFGICWISNDTNISHTEIKFDVFVNF